MPLCFSCVFLFISLPSVSNCDRLPLSPMYDLSWTAWGHNKSSVFIQSNSGRWQYSFSFLEGERILYVALPVKTRRESSGWGGLTHNVGLVHKAVGWCAVSVWWLLRTKKKCLSSLLWANISMDSHITRNLSWEFRKFGGKVLNSYGVVENEEMHQQLSPMCFWGLFPTFCFSLTLLQRLLNSSSRGPPSHLCRRWLTLASQTPACTTPGPPSPTQPTPPALASVASACQPPPDITPTCRLPTPTTNLRTSSPTPTCITAQALAPTSFPWWHQGTPGASALPPACCPAQVPQAPAAPTAWWTWAWMPRVKVWRPMAATATPPPPWALRVAWMSPFGGLID